MTSQKSSKTGILSHYKLAGSVLALNLLLFLIPHSVSLSAGVRPAHPPILSGYLAAHETVQNMTIEEMIGQTLIIQVPNTIITEYNTELINTYKPGGIILFAVNISTANQTTNYTAGLQEVAAEAGIPPLFIAVDEEGGEVERIDFDPVPYSQRDLGDMNDETTTRDTASDTAEKLLNLGFNVNFAPVADIAWPGGSIMYYRSFGDNPETVSQHISWVFDEFNSAGLIGTAKHFPGHGRTLQDSHVGMPTIDISKDEWLATDALPFVTAIDSGAKMIMVGHLYYPQVDSEIASESGIWLNDILRNELGYTGLIISDDIKMGGTEENPVQAGIDMIIAGNDMIIAAVDGDTLGQIVTGLTDYYGQAGNTRELEQKVVRIIRVKEGI